MIKRTQNFGFTLIELIMVLSIAALVTTMAVPSFTTMIKNNQLTTDANKFIASINLARSEAIKRGAQVVLCKSANSTSCNTGTTGWQQGWLAFVDTDKDNTLDSGEAIIRLYGALSANNSLVGFGSTSNYGAANNFIAYNSSGYSTASGKLELVLCDSRNDLSVAKGIRVTASGRPNVVSGTALGSSLNCS